MFFLLSKIPMWAWLLIFVVGGIIVVGGIFFGWKWIKNFISGINPMDMVKNALSGLNPFDCGDKCKPDEYCKVGSCSKKNKPGETCLAGQHQQCVGESKCIVSAQGGRCSAGKDGKNPPAKESDDHYTALGAKGCSAVLPCPPGYYCPAAMPLGDDPCKPAQKPGESCLAGQHNQCKGKSKCILGTRLAKCSAGKDGKNPPGAPGNPPDDHYQALGVPGCGPETNCPPGYYCPVGNGPCKPAQDPGASCLAGQHNQCKGGSECILGTRLAKCSAGRDGKNPPGRAGNPGNEHYQALGHPGCGPATNCPPGYYCPIGNGPCKKAQAPGATCLAGQHNQCKGASHCVLGTRGARCSAGRDGNNPPGAAGNPANEHYQKLGVPGCGVATNCPPGYYCPVGNGPCKKAQNPGASCLTGQHNQCKGASKCILGASGGRCSAGKDGKNPPGEKGNPSNAHYQALGKPGCSAASNCPPGYYCVIGWKPCKKQGSPGDECYLAGDHNRCKGSSKCKLSAQGARCSDSKGYMALGTKGCSAAFQCPPGYHCPAAFPLGNDPCRKDSKKSTTDKAIDTVSVW